MHPVNSVVFASRSDSNPRILQWDLLSATHQKAGLHKQSDGIRQIRRWGLASAASRNHCFRKQSDRIRWILQCVPGLGRRCCKEGAASQAAKENVSKAQKTNKHVSQNGRAGLRADRSGGEAACRQVKRRGDIATSFPNTERKGKGLPGGPRK